MLACDFRGLALFFTQADLNAELKENTATPKQLRLAAPILVRIPGSDTVTKGYILSDTSKRGIQVEAFLDTSVAMQIVSSPLNSSQVLGIAEMAFKKAAEKDKGQNKTIEHLLFGKTVGLPDIRLRGERAARLKKTRRRGEVAGSGTVARDSEASDSDVDVSAPEGNYSSSDESHASDSESSCASAKTKILVAPSADAPQDATVVAHEQQHSKVVKVEPELDPVTPQKGFDVANQAVPSSRLPFQLA